MHIDVLEEPTTAAEVIFYMHIDLQKKIHANNRVCICKYKSSGRIHTRSRGFAYAYTCSRRIRDSSRLHVYVPEEPIIAT